MQSIVIVGAGGFGREVLAAIKSVNELCSPRYQVIGFVDDGDARREQLDRLQMPILGTSEAVHALDAQYVIGIGTSGVRRKLDEQLVAVGAEPAPPIVHPHAWVGPDVEFGPASVICAGASVTTNVRCGRHVHINLGSTVGHDTRLGDYVTIAPLCAISGTVELEDEVELGTGVSIIPGVSIERCSLVGAGSVVTRDIPPGVIAMGAPAKPKRTK